MSDLIIVNGDSVTFLPSVGGATVTPSPTTISSSAATTKVSGKAPCLEGDERNVQSPGCPYVTTTHTIPGTGTLKIDRLGGDQFTQSTTAEGKKVILKGTIFDSVFEVSSPAQQPTNAGPVPDPVARYSGGKGSFVPSNAIGYAT